MEGKETLLSSYLAIKNEHKDAVVMYQVGGFFDLFYHDAWLAHEELGLRLLSRAMGGGKRAHMCGVPAASAKDHAHALADKGYRVILCPQQKGETGACSRGIGETVEPEGEARDLTGEWDAFLNDPPELPEPSASQSKTKPKQTPQTHDAQPGSGDELLEKLRALDIARMTPMDALVTLHSWREQYI